MSAAEVHRSVEHEIGQRLAAQGANASVAMPDGNDYRAKKEKGGERYVLVKVSVARKVEL